MLSFHVANADGYQRRVNTRGSWDPQQLIVQTCQEGAPQPATSRASTSPTALLCCNSHNQLVCSGKFSCHIIPCSFTPSPPPVVAQVATRVEDFPAWDKIRGEIKVLSVRK